MASGAARRGSDQQEKGCPPLPPGGKHAWPMTSHRSAASSPGKLVSHMMLGALLGGIGTAVGAVAPPEHGPNSSPAR